MIEVSERKDITLVTIEHGPVNAMDVELLDAIGETFRSLATKSPAAVVLTARGPAFSAGAHLFKVLEATDEEVRAAVSALPRAFGAVFEFPRPVVAAVNGHAIAGGAILACCCDHKLMAEGSGKVGLAELRVGVPFPLYAFEIVRFAVGDRNLSEVINFGRSYHQLRAVELGLIDEIVPPEQLLDRAFETADRLARIPRESFELMKSALRNPTVERVRANGARHDEEAVRLWASEPVRASIREYLTKVFGADAV